MKKAFFDAVRGAMFGGTLSQGQVEGLLHIDRAWSLYGDGDERKLAYILATAYHESDRLRAMEEYASGRGYDGRADLGNNVHGDGVRFKGRGFVMITGRRNYSDWSSRLGIDLLARPERASEREIAARILVEGMMLGTFTGKRLSDYISDGECDFLEARRIVNGTDKAGLIRGHAFSFLNALDSTAAAENPLEEARERDHWFVAFIKALLGAMWRAAGRRLRENPGAAPGD